MNKKEKSISIWRFFQIPIISALLFFMIKDIKESNITVQELTETVNNTTQHIQVYGSILGMSLLGIMFMILLQNKEKISDLIPKFNRETTKIEKNEKTTELDLELLKMIGTLIIGLLMIIFTPTLIDWLTNI